MEGKSSEEEIKTEKKRKGKWHQKKILKNKDNLLNLKRVHVGCLILLCY